MMVLFFIVGFPVFCLGIYMIYDHIRFVNVGLRTTGKVIGYKKSKGSKGTYYYNPVVRAYVGTKSEFTSGFGSSSPSYPIGKEVEVLYIEGKDPRINTPAFYVAGLFLMIFGGIFTAIYVSQFRLEWWNAGFSLAVVIALAVSIRSKMREKGIDSLEELKETFNKAKKNEEGVRITDPMEINLDYRKSRRARKSGGWVLALIGMGAVAGGLFMGVNRYEFIQTALPGQGEVVDLRESRSDDSYTYYPIVDFSPEGSFELYTFEHGVGSNPPSYRVGDEVDVLYNPDDPGDAIIDQGIFNYLFSVIIIGFGIIFGGTGVSMILQYYRNVKQIRSGQESSF